MPGIVRFAIQRIPSERFQRGRFEWSVRLFSHSPGFDPPWSISRVCKHEEAMVLFLWAPEISPPLPHWKNNFFILYLHNIFFDQKIFLPCAPAYKQPGHSASAM